MKSFSLLVLAFGLASAVPTVDEKVFADIAADGKATVLLNFNGPQTSEVISAFNSQHRPMERSVHHDVLPNMLMENANQAQAKTLEFFAARKQAKASGSQTFQLWMVNKLVVEDADMDLIQELLKRDDISHIEANHEEQLIDAVMDRDMDDEEETTDEPHLIDAQQSQKVEWGVERVGAPQVWAKGYNGTGVVVGIVDTGVYAGHETLRDNHRKDKGFYDAVGARTDSYDDQGHGTHCAGTVLGTKGIGVAPGARWIACKGLNAAGSGNTVGLNKCLQFMMCPWDGRDENTKDCSKAPKVVSNSWGSTSSHTAYNRAIDALIAQGITVLFANGNDGGNGCETTGSPADHLGVIAVGATDNKDTVTGFSSRGPTKNGEIRPDVAAPGQNIRSGWYMWSTQYRTISGTSMATPHVAGIAALYLSKNPEMTHQQIKDQLMKDAKRTVSTGQSCGPAKNGQGRREPVKDDQYPNYHVGQGLTYAPTFFQ